MLETIIVLLYISGMALTTVTIYGSMDDAHPVKAALAIVLWPVVPFVVGLIALWGAAVERIK